MSEKSWIIQRVIESREVKVLCYVSASPPNTRASRTSMPYTSLRLARHPRKHATDATHASTNSTLFLKLVLRKV